MKSVPRYSQIINYYKALIDSGKLAESDQMPTEEAIGELFSVSRITVRQALDGLTQDGYIYKIQGKGSFVSSHKTDMQLNHLIGFSDEMRSLGLEPSTRLVEQQLIPAGKVVADALGIAEQQKVYYLVRLRCADGIPMAVEHLHMPFFRFPGLEAADFSGSLYRSLREKYACETAKAVQRIQAGAATGREAHLLEIKAGAPVLRICRTTYEANGSAFEYVESVYRGDKYVFNVTLNK